MINEYEMQELKEEILADIDLNHDTEDEEIQGIIRKRCGWYAKEHMLGIEARQELEQT